MLYSEEWRWKPSDEFPDEKRIAVLNCIIFTAHAFYPNKIFQEPFSDTMLWLMVSLLLWRAKRSLKRSIQQA